MAFYSPSTSFYPCPIRAADVFKPLPTPPPIYYLRDHVRVEYNDSDWATTPEGEEETDTAEGANESNHVTATGGASMVVRARRPLGLLSVKMREHREKENIGSNNDEIPKYGQFASPAEQSAPAAKVDIPQGPPSVLNSMKVISESNVKPRTRKPLVAANTNANARKKSKAASKSSRRRIQVVLTHSAEEKENHPHVSSDSDDEIDDPLHHAHSAQKNPGKWQKQEEEQMSWATKVDMLPDPFVLTSSDELDDPLEGGQSETNGPTAGAPDKVEGITTKGSDPAPVTTAETTDIDKAWSPKSCLRAANAPSKGHTVTFKESLFKFHFYYYPDPNGIWLPRRLTFNHQQKVTY